MEERRAGLQLQLAPSSMGPRGSTQPTASGSTALVPQPWACSQAGLMYESWLCVQSHLKVTPAYGDCLHMWVRHMDVLSHIVHCTVDLSSHPKVIRWPYRLAMHGHRGQ
jgi:hypothetical protein